MADDKTAAPTMEQVKADMVVKAKKDGKIDQRDILAAIPDVPENAEVLDALYTELADLNVEVVGTRLLSFCPELPPLPAKALLHELAEPWTGETVR